MWSGRSIKAHLFNQQYHTTACTAKKQQFACTVIHRCISFIVFIFFYFSNHLLTFVNHECQGLSCCGCWEGNVHAPCCEGIWTCVFYAVESFSCAKSASWNGSKETGIAFGRGNWLCQIEKDDDFCCVLEYIVLKTKTNWTEIRRYKPGYDSHVIAVKLFLADAVCLLCE